MTTTIISCGYVKISIPLLQEKLIIPFLIILIFFFLITISHPFYYYSGYHISKILANLRFYCSLVIKRIVFLLYNLYYVK